MTSESTAAKTESMRTLTTIDEVLAALGGDLAVAALFGRGRRTAVNWRKRGGFPPKTYEVMREELRARGWVAPPSLWGMDRRVGAGGGEDIKVAVSAGGSGQADRSVRAGDTRAA